jgi:hypothetical protein
MTVAEECKRRHGEKPCIKYYAADMVTVTGGRDCTDWCPILRKRVDQQYVEPERDAAQ